jgi:hypothetical protein
MIKMIISSMRDEDVTGNNQKVVFVSVHYVIQLEYRRLCSLSLSLSLSLLVEVGGSKVVFPHVRLVLKLSASIYSFVLTAAAAADPIGTELGFIALPLLGQGCHIPNLTLILDY